MMNRGCSRNCAWLCRAMVVFNVACLLYLGYQAYRGYHQPAADRVPGGMAGRSAASGSQRRESPGDLEDTFDSRAAAAARMRGLARDVDAGANPAVLLQARRPPPAAPAPVAQHDEEDLAEDEAPPRRHPMKPHPPPQERPRSPKFEERAEEPEEAPAPPPKRPKSLPLKPLNAEAAEAPAPAPAAAGPMKVFIVEEHHEVLPYWHQIYDSESKRRGANLSPLSLVHIDGHSDGAPIFPDKRFPFKTKLSSATQIKYLMTSNDNFVMGSRVAGLVSHAVWVYPTWCFLNDTELDISMTGVSKINATLQACSCPHYEADRHPLEMGAINTTDTCSMDTRSMEAKRLWFHRKFCYFLKGPFLQTFAPENNITMDILHSTLTRRLQLPETRPEARTMGTLYRPVTSAAEHNDYLLDIDEDYFGVQLAGRQLENAKIPLRAMVYTRDELEALFCPEVISAEVQADRWFVALLRTIARVTAKCDGDCSESAMSQQVADDPKLNGLLRAAVCKLLPASQRRPLVESLTQKLLPLTQEQLRVLQSVGLCLGMSLKTNLDPMDSLVKGAKGSRRIKGPEPVVKICLGHNMPNESVVQEFVDTRAGIDARMATMTAILRRLPKPPVAVTICRSSRDGYVPRHQMAYIEAGVLASLRAVFGQLDVRYDPDLYFGREGWIGYKARQLGEDFRLPGVKL